jgi:GTP pyrophosphokinase
MVKIKEDLAKSADGRFDVPACVGGLVDRDPRLDPERLNAACRFVEGLPRKDQELLAIGLEFAHLLVDLDLDTDAVCAAITYRCFRGRHASLEALAKAIGDGPAALVSDVERMASVSLLELSNTPLLSTESRDQVDNVRKMLVALIDDVRVAIVKLAERIIALRRAKSMAPLRQQRLAREVLEVFSPLANRLGIWRLKWELEDLAFRYLEPDAYKEVAARFDGRRAERERQIGAIEQSLERALRAEGIEAEVVGRAKHIYSIWRKMHTKHVDFAEIYDVRAVRVLVDSTRSCYSALGVIHTNWRHIPSEFDDYIANPKDNGYRSIHTAVAAPDGKILEVQIRTQEMHREAELGVCAHWSYKDASQSRPTDNAYSEKLDWLRQVLDWHEEVGGFTAVGDELRANIQQDRIYVFTPGGHVVDLTAGATPIDFAYRVHTEIGHHCSGARVNGSLVPLSTPLSTGQNVEIITSASQQPSRDWLDPNLGFVKSARAKAKVQGWFRALDASQNIAAGSNLLERELECLAIRADLQRVSERLGYSDAAGLYYGLGVGDLSVFDVVAVVDDLPAEQLDLLPSGPSIIEDAGRLSVALGICCRPIVGCEIVAAANEESIIVHRISCDHAQTAVPAQWSGAHARRKFRLEIRGYDRAGLLHDITAVLLADRVSMGSMEATSDSSDNTARIAFDLETDGLGGLARIVDRVRQVTGIIEARRIG